MIEEQDYTALLSTQALISRSQLRKLVPVSNMTIWRWEKDGKLPHHVVIGRSSFWRIADIRAFLDAAR